MWQRLIVSLTIRRNLKVYINIFIYCTFSCIWGPNIVYGRIVRYNEKGLLLPSAGAESL